MNRHSAPVQPDIDIDEHVQFATINPATPAIWFLAHLCLTTQHFGP